MKGTLLFNSALWLLVAFLDILADFFWVALFFRGCGALLFCDLLSYGSALLLKVCRTLLSGFSFCSLCAINLLLRAALPLCLYFLPVDNLSGTFLLHFGLIAGLELGAAPLLHFVLIAGLEFGGALLLNLWFIAGLKLGGALFFNLSFIAGLQLGLALLLQLSLVLSHQLSCALRLNNNATLGLILSLIGGLALVLKILGLGQVAWDQNKEKCKLKYRMKYNIICIFDNITF